MSEERFELSRVSPHGPKPCAYANSATPTLIFKFYFMDGLKSIFSDQNRTKIFIICGLFLIFFIGLKAPTDPDFGWHLRNGWEILANRSIPHFDPYSFSMSDFPWLCFSWLSDFFVALCQKLFGLFGLSMFFSLITAAAFFLAARAYQSKISYQIIIAMLGIILSVSVMGIRDQMWSILGLAVLIFILVIWRKNPQSKIIWWLPFLFLLWTNLHSAFAIGLGTLLVFFLTELTQKKPLTKTLFFVFILSCLATFINPYGPRIYKEIWITFIDFSGRSQIIEWQPLFYVGLNIFLPTIIFGLSLLAAQFFARKRDFTLITLSILFFIFALLAWRNLPLFFIASSPLAVLTLENYAGKNLLDLIKMPLTILAIFVLTFYVGWHNIKEVWTLDTNPQALAKEANFPYGAVKFLASNHLPLSTDHLFNEYNWGGYLLWQLPNIKVFIDGRMTHWQLPGRHIFAEYQTLQAAKNLAVANSLIKKYDLNLALIRPASPLAFYLSVIGWQKIYEDNLAIILKKS